MHILWNLTRVAWLGAFLLGVVGSSVSAGVLVSGGGGIPGFTGTQLFDNNVSGFTVSANVDYAVFAPGDFGTAFPGGDPSGGTEYVYAYQIENLDTDITTMTVGLDGDESLGSVGFLVDGALVSPSASQFVGGGPTSAAWDFDPGQLINGSTSTILFFTSADAPEFDMATVSAAYADTHDLPSPLPEPAGLGLLVLGVGTGLLRVRRRT